MKKSITVAIIVAIIVVLIIAAGTAIFVMSLKTPETNVDSVVLKSLDLNAKTMTFLVTLVINKPNSISIELEDIQVNIYVDQVYVGVINQTVNRQLGAGADTKVEVDMVASNAPVLGSSKINVEVTGVSHAKVLWSERTSDINDVETLDIADKLPPLNTPPVAVIVDDAGLVTLQMFEITFDGQGSFDTDGTITKFAWTFGDGTVADGSVVKHKYSLPGTYTVVLKVTDDRAATGNATRIVAVV
jgi:hypothetical protein